ncbi:ATP-binding cassette domain-containing protein [Streptomyces durbertensis]|uniref:ATP-binding cassette domain-containing protein n=1 Tax=Streptomyces durbertensis TaxID=2448886 RepID=A0ABR6ECH3_9ACTN|nr:ATP-binding cassette domain-containing protein [Streptomyces durbertensis]MBB1243018.1 ATP-binding cassette domain-containing protein [Streptomyces durbertensis]
MSKAIVAEGLTKRYGDVAALDGLSIAVDEGTVLGLLGPNGAGKTTTVRVLSTLLRPDSGTATVNGLDVVSDARRLRTMIGLSGQYAAVDEDLTARENLEMVSRLYRMGRKRSRERATELLERFDLVEPADRPVGGYSGGMRRRVDLACALVAQPSVLFLDEPTTGLDPRSRIAMWEVISELVAGGSTLLLTTQYLEEADQLADRIAVIDHGQLIADGTPDQLKDRLGGERMEIALHAAADAPEVSRALASLASGEITVSEDGTEVIVPVANGAEALLDGVRLIDAAGVRPAGVQVRRPSLDEVFLALTGASAAPSAPAAGPASGTVTPPGVPGQAAVPEQAGPDDQEVAVAVKETIR